MAVTGVPLQKFVTSVWKKNQSAFIERWGDFVSTSAVEWF